MAGLLAFAGSARKNSLNKRLVAILAAGARAAGADVTQIDLADYPLPLYDGDLEAAAGLPHNVLRLKELFVRHDGLLLACPEYNSAITPLLKNTLDWVSRPAPGEKPLACYTGKVAGLAAASPGALGGLRGLAVVRSILSNVRVLVVPEQVAIPRAHEAFGDDGRLTDAKLQAAVEGVGAASARLMARVRA